MEEYYGKYAKSLKDISMSEAKSRLEDWQHFTKEEIELLIFIINSIDNDNRNYMLLGLSQSSKMKLISTIETLKSSSIDVLNKISDFICRISTQEYNHVTNKIYSKIEHIRSDYNRQLQNNYNTLLSKEIYSEFKSEYYKTQKWLRENKGGQTERNYFNHNSIKQQQSSKHKISKASTQANIPKLNMSKVKESLSRNKGSHDCVNDSNINTNNSNHNHNHHSVFTKIYLDKAKQNKDNNGNNDDKCNNKWLGNQSCDSDSNELVSKQRPLSHRNKLPPKHSNQDSLLNYTDTHLNKIPLSSDQFSQIIKIKTEIMLIQEDIKKLKGKNGLKAPPSRQIDEEFVSQLTKQNNEMWSEMSIMRKEMNELFNTVKTLNEKISNVLDENKSLKLENDQLKDDLYELKQDKSSLINVNSNSMNHLNNINSRNSNSTSHLFRPQAKTNVNVNKNYTKAVDTIIKAQRLNYQYDSSSCNSISDLQDNYSKNDNSKD